MDFSGFAEGDGQLQEKLNARKLTMLEVKVEEIWEKVRDLEIRNGRLEQENKSLRKELENEEKVLQKEIHKEIQIRMLEMKMGMMDKMMKAREIQMNMLEERMKKIKSKTKTGISKLRKAKNKFKEMAERSVNKCEELEKK